MRPNAIVLMLCITVVCAAPLLAQNDVNSQTQSSLETAYRNGQATTAQQLALARLYLESGRAYEASKIARAVLSSDPVNADAAAIRDEAAAKMRAAAESKIGEAEANTRKPGAGDAERLALADAYFEGAAYATAAGVYAKLPQAAMNRDAQLRYARALAWSGDMDHAEQVYARLLAEERTPDLQLEYGRLLSWMGASRAAVQNLRAAYEANPSEDAAIALANAEAWSGNREEAMHFLADYTASHPGALEARRTLDQMRASPELRIEQVGRMIDAEPFNLALRLERARLLVDAGRYSQALADIRFIREHSARMPDGVEELEARANSLREQELARVNEQRKALDLRNPRDPEAILSLAKAYTGLADYASAIELYDVYLRLRPDDTNARIAYARVLSWDRRYAAAARQYEKVIERNPDRADLRLEHAQVLSYDADFAGAMHMFSSLTDLSDNPRAHLYPDVPPKAHYNLGQIYRWYGWNEHAVTEQNRALALDSSYIPARQELDLARHLRPRSNLEGRYTYATDSNDFTLRRADFSGEKWVSQRTAYTGGIGRHEFEHAGDTVSAFSLNAGAMYRYSDRWLARGNVGATLYEEGLGTRPFWGIGAQWMPNIQSRAALDYNRYDLVYDVFTLTSLQRPGVRSNDPIAIDDFRAHYDYNSGGFLSWLGDASYGFISDDNKRAAAHGLVTFRVWKQPFVALKVDGRRLSYDFRTNRYWSPTDYSSLAGVLQVGQNVRNRFFWSAELKYGRSWEGEFKSDLRSYAANVTVPVNDAIDLIGNYGYGKSGRLDSILGTSGTDFVNYWQRHWFVGVRVKQLFAREDRGGPSSYYYDTRPLSGSPVIPPLGETH